MANSVDPDQTAPLSSLIRVCNCLIRLKCPSINIFTVFYPFHTLELLCQTVLTYGANAPVEVQSSILLNAKKASKIFIFSLSVICVFMNNSLMSSRSLSRETRKSEDQPRPELTAVKDLGLVVQN